LGPGEYELRIRATLPAQECSARARVLVLLHQKLRVLGLLFCELQMKRGLRHVGGADLRGCAFGRGLGGELCRRGLRAGGPTNAHCRRCERRGGKSDARSFDLMLGFFALPSRRCFCGTHARRPNAGISIEPEGVRRAPAHGCGGSARCAMRQGCDCSSGHDACSSSRRKERMMKTKPMILTMLLSAIALAAPARA